MSEAKQFHGRRALLLLLLLSGCAIHTPSARDLTRPGTLPPPRDLSAADQVLFLVLGDTGRGNEAQRQVGQLMAQVCESHRPGGGCDFALVTGDLIYNTGVRGVNDPKFSSHFEVPFEKLRQLPMWSVPGNHDWYRPGSVQAEINYTTAKTGWRMPFNHFAVPGLPEWLHIYGLDTAIADDLNRGNSEQKAVLSELVELQRQAVRETLCAKPGWRFLFGHHPIYSSGQHGRDDGPDGVAPGIREALEGIIQDCKVQAYFAGHDHLQEHLVAEPGPFHQIIQGAASEVRKSDRPFTLPGTLPKVERTFLARKFGFALVTVSRQAAEVEFYGFEDEKGPLDNERKAMYRFAMSQ